MAENIPGVRAREIDISQPTPQGIDGIPAGVIGTAQQGPAFVPVTISNFQDFEAIFGVIDKVKDKSLFGPVAAQQWLRNANALTYVRVLGAGDGKQRNSDDTVTNGGFVAGNQLPQADGFLGDNPFANAGGLGAGRVYFLGAYMSQSSTSTIFSDAGLQTLGEERGHPILRGVLFAASGTALTLSSSNGVSNTLASSDDSSANVGFITGTVNFENGAPHFTMFVKGLKDADLNVITASLDPEQEKEYFATVFNTDPAKIEERGHYLYTHYDVYSQYAVVTGSGLTQVGPDIVNKKAQRDEKYIGSSDCVFLTTGALNRNTVSGDAPNYEGFTTRFDHSRSPFVISQKFGGSAKNLFKVHAKGDGVIKSKASDPTGANTKFKISIENVRKSSDPNNDYGTFDLVVRDLFDQDEPSKQIPLETFRGLSLDPGADRYIGRIIGDRNVFYDFEQQTGFQKVVVEGKYASRSNLIRVEIDSDVENGDIDATALPVGFRGLDHLITSGSAPLTAVPDNDLQTHASELLKATVEPPVPFRETLLLASGTATAKSKASLYWGVQFQRKSSTSKPNEDSQAEPTILSHTKFFPNFYGLNSANMNVITGSNAGQPDSAGIVFDADRFNNNIFTLENVQILTGSGDKADASSTGLKEWRYVRQGSIVPNEADKTRAWSVDDTGDQKVSNVSKFSFPIQGGFDGVNIFDSSSANLTEDAAKGEMDDSNRGQRNGPTVAAYFKALDVMADKSDVDIQLLAIPGIRQEVITDQAILKVEDRFDALYLMDIEERDNVNTVVTSSIQKDKINVANTVTAFNGRNLDSSFAAAYFPDVTMEVDQKSLDTQTKVLRTQTTSVVVPPSVAVLGAFSANDRVAFPWFAPAGFSRGALAGVSEVKTKLNEENVQDLNNAKINPIQTFPNSGPVVFGQRTLQQAASALDRVNVRRLLIDIRRSVRQAANQILFEPNREATLARLSARVRPILQNVQQNAGIDRFKVIIDASTTSQADVENNIVRGKIFIQPTRTAEFISLDFVVTNAGVEGI
jgi:phage tail sheath protein FI